MEPSPNTQPNSDPSSSQSTPVNGLNTSLGSTQSDQPQNTQGRKYKLMIVEDEDDSRSVLVRLFESVNKYDVSSSNDGTDCLAKLEAETQKFDMVLLDIVMPKLDGIETLRIIRSAPEKYGNPIILMLTNLGGEVAIDTTKMIGAQGYLMKIETEPAVLLEKVAEEFKKFEAGNYPPKVEPQPAQQNQ